MKGGVVTIVCLTLEAQEHPKAALMESLSSELQSGPSDQGPKCGAFTQGAVWTQMMGQPVS